MLCLGPHRISICIVLWLAYFGQLCHLEPCMYGSHQCFRHEVWYAMHGTSMGQWIASDMMHMWMPYTSSKGMIWTWGMTGILHVTDMFSLPVSQNSIIFSPAVRHCGELVLIMKSWWTLDYSVFPFPIALALPLNRHLHGSSAVQTDTWVNVVHSLCQPVVEVSYTVQRWWKHVSNHWKASN